MRQNTLGDVAQRSNAGFNLRAPHDSAERRARRRRLVRLVKSSWSRMAASGWPPVVARRDAGRDGLLGALIIVHREWSAGRKQWTGLPFRLVSRDEDEVRAPQHCAFHVGAGLVDARLAEAERAQQVPR